MTLSLPSYGRIRIVCCAYLLDKWINQLFWTCFVTRVHWVEFNLFLRFQVRIRFTFNKHWHDVLRFNDTRMEIMHRILALFSHLYSHRCMSWIMTKSWQLTFTQLSNVAHSLSLFNDTGNYFLALTSNNFWYFRCPLIVVSSNFTSSSTIDGCSVLSIAASVISSSALNVFNPIENPITMRQIKYFMISLFFVFFFSSIFYVQYSHTVSRTVMKLINKLLIFIYCRDSCPDKLKRILLHFLPFAAEWIYNIIFFLLFFLHAVLLTRLQFNFVLPSQIVVGCLMQINFMSNYIHKYIDIDIDIDNVLFICGHHAI